MRNLAGWKACGPFKCVYFPVPPYLPSLLSPSPSFSFARSHTSQRLPCFHHPLPLLLSPLFLLLTLPVLSSTTRNPFVTTVPPPHFSTPTPTHPVRHHSPHQSPPLSTFPRLLSPQRRLSLFTTPSPPSFSLAEQTRSTGPATSLPNLDSTERHTITFSTCSKPFSRHGVSSSTCPCFDETWLAASPHRLLPHRRVPTSTRRCYTTPSSPSLAAFTAVLGSSSLSRRSTRMPLPSSSSLKAPPPFSPKANRTLSTRRNSPVSPSTTKRGHLSNRSVRTRCSVPSER
jgi:hypothetical protein